MLVPARPMCIDTIRRHDHVSTRGPITDVASSATVRRSLLSREQAREGVRWPMQQCLHLNMPALSLCNVAAVNDVQRIIKACAELLP